MGCFVSHNDCDSYGLHPLILSAGVGERGKMGEEGEEKGKEEGEEGEEEEEEEWKEEREVGVNVKAQVEAEYFN